MRDGRRDLHPPVCAPCLDHDCSGCQGGRCVCEHYCYEGVALVMKNEHDYVSTACHHAKHEPTLHNRCRVRCTFCNTPCRCSCHTVRAAEETSGA